VLGCWWGFFGGLGLGGKGGINLGGQRFKIKKIATFSGHSKNWGEKKKLSVGGKGKSALGSQERGSKLQEKKGGKGGGGEGTRDAGKKHYCFPRCYYLLNVEVYIEVFFLQGKNFKG